jgi:acyl dehydratase
MKTLYLEDFTVGQRYPSETRRIDADQIKLFAQRFDPQPFHLDEAAAQTSFFKGLAASGWHTASITMSLLVKSMPIAGGLIGAGGELQWPKPVRPGDVLQVESEVLEIKPSRSKPDRGMISVRSVTKNQNGEDVQILTSRMLVWRRPVPIEM